MCVRDICVHECRCLERQEEGIRSPGGGVTGSCEPTSVGAGNQTVSFKRVACALSCWVTSLAPGDPFLQCLQSRCYRCMLLWPDGFCCCFYNFFKYRFLGSELRTSFCALLTEPQMFLYGGGALRREGWVCVCVCVSEHFVSLIKYI